MRTPLLYRSDANTLLSSLTPFSRLAGSMLMCVGLAWTPVALAQQDTRLGSPVVTDMVTDREWMDVGQEVLAQVNMARREARSCGDQQFGAANPLTWDARLARAALEQSQYMAKSGMFGHVGPDGEGLKARVDMVDYEWGTLAENVAVGHTSPEKVVAAWLESPGHCANIMNPEFTDLGAAYDNSADSAIFWTQVFGSER